MIRHFLHSKIHRATVTEVDLDYEGSLTLDPLLMEKANIAQHEQINVYNITQGGRFTTYAIEGSQGSGEVCVNGAAAHHAAVGDLIIIVTYCDLHEQEINQFSSTIVFVDEKNQPL
ncbi:MAG: aspartate 1-decarboxylase [Candidatus Electryonea clarkiae]|nr:aspartate 1-decarboxylase [Candidatus Electryonea clarkiae]MDP8286220.1 aspartate 1-decarboxylase [Candidatus Electryonea clarkiae]